MMTLTAGSRARRLASFRPLPLSISRHFFYLSFFFLDLFLVLNFDRVPSFPHKEVIRNKEKRRELKGFECRQCTEVSIFEPFEQIGFFDNIDFPFLSWLVF
jgi:hypothetical protein